MQGRIPFALLVGGIVVSVTVSVISLNRAMRANTRAIQAEGRLEHLEDHANLAAQVHRWSEFRATLRPHAGGSVKSLVLQALALGWSEKWRTG